MPFPLSTSDMWKMFTLANSQEAKNKKAVCEWLDAVYTDLEDLSKVWIKICASPETAADDKEKARALKIIHRGVGSSQGVNGGRLIAFYESASKVLGYKRRADFVDKLSGLLLERGEGRTAVEKDAEPGATSQSTTQRLIEMRAFAQAIQKDLGSLKVLIHTFRMEG